MRASECVLLWASLNHPPFGGARKQVVALARRSRRDIQSGLARVLSLVRIDVNCECYYLGVIGVFLLFFFFGFSFLVQRPLSCSPTAARHFASLGQQGAVRREAFLVIPVRLTFFSRSPALADLNTQADRIGFIHKLHPG